MCLYLLENTLRCWYTVVIVHGEIFRDIQTKKERARAREKLRVGREEESDGLYMENQRRFWLAKPRPVSFESKVTNRTAYWTSQRGTRCLLFILSVIQHAILVRAFIILCAYTLDRCANVCSARKLVFRCLICYGTANDGHSKDRVILFCI